MVFGGQFMVALCFAELAARYPVAGLGLQLVEEDRQSASRLARRVACADRVHRGPISAVALAYRS
ncbi:hypothetical protein LT493_30645 [Streptomyces tricolor]|nr:hypothetical protein [Streptomyces tricolor]